MKLDVYTSDIVTLDVNCDRSLSRHSQSSSS